MCGDSRFLNIQVTPPQDGERQPLVMFIALDNSGSMAEAATEQAEGSAFTRMDLCKHTVRTIAGMCGDRDILCLTSFSTTAKVVMKPTLMTKEGKERLETSISSIQPDAQTNIWAALELVNRLASAPEFSGRNVVAALLTDGMPNMDPPRGIVPTYRDLPKPSTFTLSTFGFGYKLDSVMLTELACLGGGSFGFIPDYSMVATVFINWAASMLSMAATSGRVRVRAAGDGGGGGGTVEPLLATFPTGPIQIGQARNFLLPLSNLHPPTGAPLPNKFLVELVLGADDTNVSSQVIVDCSGCEGSTTTHLPPFLCAREQVMAAIKATLESGGGTGGGKFDGIYSQYAPMGGPVLELVKDVRPSPDAEEQGQVFMAPRYYGSWGKHYLRAYLRAQELQQCMNFKDPGLQMYGGALFKLLQRLGDDVFATLPALEPTGEVPTSCRGPPGASRHNSSSSTGGGGGATVNMGNVFNNPRGGCWAPGSLVEMGDGQRKAIETLNPGDVVFTPEGPAVVQYVIEIGTKARAQSMCKVGADPGLWVTPWHPVLLLKPGDSVSSTPTWGFPASISPITERIMPKVFNLILSRGHVIRVGGVLSCTLGHGLKGDVIEHPFFGSRESVLRDLAGCPGFAQGRPVFEDLIHTKEQGVIVKWRDAVLA